MKDMEERRADPGRPAEMEYMPSIKQLGNKYYDQYIDRKTNARHDIIEKGSFSKSYMNYINYPPGSYKPSGIKIFPSVGMLSNKQAFITN